MQPSLEFKPVRSSVALWELLHASSSLCNRCELGWIKVADPITIRQAILFSSVSILTYGRDFFLLAV
jgi:hypothetical protein